MKGIHPTTLISGDVELGEDVEIGPYCIINGHVRIGDKTRLLSNVIIEGKVEIGSMCTIYPFTSIGLPPQDIKYKDEDTGVKLGNNNIIREYVTIHRASIGGDRWTEVGNNNFIMAYAHIAHDCKIGSNIIMANVATLAGHVKVYDYAVIGGLVAVHQFTRIGSYAMVGGFSGIAQDVPPYMMASGARASLYGLNIVGLKRHGFSDETISILKKAYKIIFKSGMTLHDALRKIQEDLPYTDQIRNLIEFINENKRGIMR